MKIYKFLTAMVILLLGTMAVSCDEERDYILIEGEIPLKTSSLYIIGDATSAVWDINNPVPLVKSEADPCVFIFDGFLAQGEMKAYLSPGSFDGPCIHPLTAWSPISDVDVKGEPIQLYSGGEDLKWSVKTAGHYRLEFDLRNWVLNTTYLGGS